jgi:hypothetical protein
MKMVRVVLLLSCLSLPACYEFDFPLDPTPQVKLDTRLLGAWRCLGTQSDLDEAPGVLRIARRTDTLSTWSIESLASDGSKERSEYEVHASTIKGGSLLNLRDVGEKTDGKWSFVKYSFLLPDVVRIQVVNDEPFKKIKDANTLREQIEKRRNDPAIYVDFMVCVRPRPSSEPSATPKP